MVYNKPLLIVFAGNNGQTTTNDIWVLEVESLNWHQVTLLTARKPPGRVYHSMELCREGPAAGMMVVFGGRTGENRSLLDTWGLRQHRDGRWDWVEAPVKRGQPPEARFQHTALFQGSLMLVLGGRGSDVAKPLPTVVYDTETCEWRTVASVHRFRHASWGGPSSVYTYGGFDHACPSAPTPDLQFLDLEGSDPFKGGAGADAIRDQRYGRPPERASQASPVDASAHWTGIKLAPQVMVSLEKDFTHIVRKVGIETLEDESRKMDPASRLIGVGQEQTNGIHTWVIKLLLQPNTWAPQQADQFVLSRRDVLELFDRVLDQMQREATVLHLRAPIKVYGDIHGQYLDLMRLFARYKSPSDGEGGDIETMDYLFLGDFVDRGSYSLEVVCLLFALKLKYPTQVHMIRGNHEDPAINSLYGFRDECRRRLQEDPDEPGSCWEKCNTVFSWLPLAATIEGQILCLHGGIGGTVQSIEDIEAIPRPLVVNQVPQTPQEQQVTDLLWSDPSDNDDFVGVTNNETRDPDGTGSIVKFGPDRVHEFLKSNPPLKLIIRAHECVMDGFERFADGKLITLFSATDYCGHHKNAGALLFIRRDLTVQPKLIYPQERAANTEASGTWDENVTSARPPTPPRVRGRREE